MSAIRPRYNLDPMLSASSVYWAFSNSRLTQDPEYVKAVIRNYVHFKNHRGKTKSEIAYKLEGLEREFSQFAYAFRAIRLEYSLPPSRILPAPRVTSDSNNLRRVQTATTSSPARNTNIITRTNTTVGATTNRPTPQNNNDDEPPPPPYQSNDPEPEATRALQESLAAEAERNGTFPIGSQIVNSPNTATTTTTSTALSPPISSPTRSNQPIDEGPQRVPSDPDLARAWEESQLEEAKRASLAWQVEQQELQEAMRLSLVDSDSRLEGSNFSSNSAGPSNHPITSIPENRTAGENINFNVEMDDLIDDVDNLNIPGSYDPPSTSTSTATTSNNQNQIQNLLDEQSTSSYSGQPPLTPQKTGFHIQSKNPFLSSNEKEQLQAMEEAALTTPTSEHFRTPSFSAAPGSSYTQYNPPVGPQSPPQSQPQPQPQPQPRQSFSSVREAGSTPAYQSAPVGPPLTHPQQYTPPPLATGSSYTQYTPPSDSAPSGPSQQLYTPPSGPPPAHLRVVTPTSPTTRPLPATPKDQFPWEEPSSSRIAFPQPMASPISISQPSISPPIAESHNSLHQTLQGTPPRLPARKKTFVPPPGKEDALETLKDFDTVFLVDDSTSMAGNRWSEARQALMEVAEIAARYDENGVDIYFLNSKRVGKELKAAHEVEDLFRGLEPKGATPTGMRLESILRDYMSKLERSQTSSPISNGHSDISVKPMNLIVVTDGVFAHPVLTRKRLLESNQNTDHLTLLQSAPTDDPESVLIACAKRLDRGEFPLSQVGVQFLQIGNDSEAREALQELDDGLSAAHGVRDIVDTVPYAGEDMSAGLIIKTLLGGINRRLDRRSSA